MAFTDLGKEPQRKDVAVLTTDDTRYFCVEANIKEMKNALMVKMNWKGNELQGCLLREDEINPWAPLNLLADRDADVYLRMSYKMGRIERRLKAKKIVSDFDVLSWATLKYMYSDCETQFKKRKVEESGQDTNRVSTEKSESYKKKYPRCFVHECNIIRSRRRKESRRSGRRQSSSPEPASLNESEVQGPLTRTKRGNKLE